MSNKQLYVPDFILPECMEKLGYKDNGHPGGADKGFYCYISYGHTANHREGRECEQILWHSKRQIWFNCGYAVADKAVYCKIYDRLGTRTVFNGVIETEEQLKLILRLVEY